MAGEQQSRWIFTKSQLENTPSRKSGVDSDKELSYRQQGANFIQDMGQRLQVTQLCINTSILYMHRFYMFHSFSKFPRNNIAAACLFLAAKVEEQPRKLEHVIKVAHMCTSRDSQPLDVQSEAYLEQAQELVVNENILLQTLGFEITVDHPHTHVVKTCQLVHASKDLAQTSYFLATNSLHLTTMALQYRPTVVACVCIHLACQWANFEIPTSSESREWFWYTDRSVTLELLEELTQEFLNILEKCPSKLKKKIMTWKSGRGEGMEDPVITRRIKSDPSAKEASGLHKSSSVPAFKSDTKSVAASHPSGMREPILSTLEKASMLGSVGSRSSTPTQAPSQPTDTTDAGVKRPRETAISHRQYLERKERERQQAAMAKQTASHRTEQHRAEAYHSSAPQDQLAGSPALGRNTKGSDKLHPEQSSKHKVSSADLAKLQYLSEHVQKDRQKESLQAAEATGQHRPDLSGQHRSDPSGHHRSEERSKSKHHHHHHRSHRHGDRDGSSQPSERSHRERHSSRDRNRHSSSHATGASLPPGDHSRKRPYSPMNSQGSGDREPIPPLKLPRGIMSQSSGHQEQSRSKVPSLKIKLPKPKDAEHCGPHNGGATSTANHTTHSPHLGNAVQPATRENLHQVQRQLSQLIEQRQQKLNLAQPPLPSSAPPPLPPPPPPE